MCPVPNMSCRVGGGYLEPLHFRIYAIAFISHAGTLFNVSAADFLTLQSGSDADYGFATALEREVVYSLVPTTKREMVHASFATHFETERPAAAAGHAELSGNAATAGKRDGDIWIRPVVFTTHT